MFIYQFEDGEQEKFLKSWTGEFLDKGTSCVISAILMYQLADSFFRLPLLMPFFAATVTAHIIEDVGVVYNHEPIAEIAGENATMDADQGF